MGSAYLSGLHGLLRGPSRFLVVAALVLLIAQGCVARMPWTPDDFDWDALPDRPREEWGGLFVNLTANPGPYPKEFYEMYEVKEIDGSRIAIVSFVLGLGWRTLVNIAVGLAGLEETIRGCVTSDGSTAADAGCAIAVATTILSVGVNYKTSHLKRFLGWLGFSKNKWQKGTFLDTIELDVFGKRSLNQTTIDELQKIHDETFADLLHNVAGEKPEFLGYATDDHRLGKRQEGDYHALAPRFRVRHSDIGYLDLTARHGKHETRISAEIANHRIDARDRLFRHQRLSNHLMEARFSANARAADPDKINWDPAGAYPQIRNELECYGDGKGFQRWRAGQVLATQFYDKAHQDTFGYADVGIFKDHSTDKKFEDFPAKTPLNVPPHCT